MSDGACILAHFRKDRKEILSPPSKKEEKEEKEEKKGRSQDKGPTLGSKRAIETPFAINKSRDLDLDLLAVFPSCVVLCPGNALEVPRLIH